MFTTCRRPRHHAEFVHKDDRVTPPPVAVQFDHAGHHPRR